MAACVLALLVVGPSVSMAACICVDAAPVAGVEASLAADQALRGEPQDHGVPCEAACCVGGHCHHGGAMLDAPVAAISAPVLVASAHVGTSAPALASRTLSGPDRPPRG
ncbi:hypothetical protein ASD89_02865 [Caulobacter sp. Root656]|nr:hypothetical protein ASD89_02865 [Caulobacter sp. Root656]